MKKNCFSSLHSSFFILKAQRYYLYGEASAGGKYGDGVLFRFNPFNGKDTIVFNFSSTNGKSPYGSLILSNNIIYGACEYGGSQNEGNLFRYNLQTSNESTIIDFIGTNGNIPGWGMTLSNQMLYSTTGDGGKDGYGAIFKYDLILDKDTTIFSFNDTNGAIPWGSLFALNDTSFYGMTEEGGTNNNGVIYKFNPRTDIETVLYNFNGNADGAYPEGAFIKDSNGILYSTTNDIGPKGVGTLLSFNPSTNIESTLISFSGANGGSPQQGEILATDGELYGLTTQGGSNNDGVLYSYNVNTSNYNIRINFNDTNGAFGDGLLIEDTANKILYGMTINGGKYNDGVLFSYNLNTGKDSVLLNFDGTNGANPYGTLLLVPYQSGDGVNEIKSTDENIKVYPNPAANFINIESSISSEKYFYLYDNMGRLVQSTKLESNLSTIPLGQLSAGMYYCRIVDNAQNVIRADKLLIIR